MQLIGFKNDISFKDQMAQAAIPNIDVEGRSKLFTEK